MEQYDVALRKESVDRNFGFRAILWRIGLVALRKESVDRNDLLNFLQCLICRSLSARRAWIEMSACSRAVCSAVSLSARRAWIEIFAVISLIYQQAKSLSARRAWIEIGGHYYIGNSPDGSLSARRAWIEIGYFERRLSDRGSRSPQGERG